MHVRHLLLIRSCWRINHARSIFQNTMVHLQASIQGAQSVLIGYAFSTFWLILTSFKSIIGLNMIEYSKIANQGPKHLEYSYVNTNRQKSTEFRSVPCIERELWSILRTGFFKLSAIAFKQTRIILPI